VTYVSHFLSASLPLNHVNHSREIVLAHFVPTEVPVFGFVLFMVQRGMVKTESGTAGVSKPNVIAGASSYEGRRYISVVDDPTICGVQDTMLHKDRGLHSVRLLLIGG